MVCKNCGVEVPEDMKFCTNCGANLQEEYPGFDDTFVTKEGFSGYEYSGTKRLVDRYDDRGVIERRPDSGAGFYRTAIVLLSVLIVVILVVGTVFAIKYFEDDNGGGNSKISITVNECPSQTNNATLALSGSASSKNEATISINGEFVDSIGSGGGSKQWSKEVTLKKGVNDLEVTISDNEGNTERQKITVTYNSTLLYEKGTILIKGDPAAVYVRPTPQISQRYVILIPSSDFTSQFVCLGEESIDSQGYIWCKVRTPHNGNGWIRSDLIKPIN